MKTAALLVLMALAGAARSVEVDAQGRIVLTPAEAKSCADEGGCILITRALGRQIHEALRDAREKLKDAAKCGATWKRTT